MRAWDRRACGYRSKVSIRGVSFSRRSALRIQINTRHLGLWWCGDTEDKEEKGRRREVRGGRGVRGKTEEEKKVEESLEQQATAAPSFLQSWNTSKTSARKQFLYLHTPTFHAAVAIVKLSTSLRGRNGNIRATKVTRPLSFSSFRFRIIATKTIWQKTIFQRNHH